MNEIFLISENTVRKYSNISTNTQSHTLLPAIRFAHLQLELILGTNLLYRLKELVESGEIEEDKNYKYKLLIEKSRNYLIFTTIAELIMINAVKIDNFGSSMATDEHIQSLTLKENFQLKDYYEHKASQELKRLQMYLYANYGQYKEHLTSINREEFAPNLYSAANTSIYLGGARAKGYNNYKHNCYKGK